jgi:hypothetical protein
VRVRVRVCVCVCTRVTIIQLAAKRIKGESKGKRRRIMSLRASARDCFLREQHARVVCIFVICRQRERERERESRERGEGIASGRTDDGGRGGLEFLEGVHCWPFRGPVGTIMVPFTAGAPQPQAFSLKPSASNLQPQPSRPLFQCALSFFPLARLEPSWKLVLLILQHSRLGSGRTTCLSMPLFSPLYLENDLILAFRR